MLLLHTLSRLTFSNQPWKPLLSGFLLHYATAGGYRPRLPTLRALRQAHGGSGTGVLRLDRGRPVLLGLLC